MKKQILSALLFLCLMAGLLAGTLPASAAVGAEPAGEPLYMAATTRMCMALPDAELFLGQYDAQGRMLTISRVEADAQGLVQSVWVSGAAEARLFCLGSDGVPLAEEASVTPNAVQDTDISPTQQELLVAAKLGLDLSWTEKATVTAREFAAMVDLVVYDFNPEKLSSWQSRFATLHASTEQMDRVNAMIVLFLSAYHVFDGEIPWFRSSVRVGSKLSLPFEGNQLSKDHLYQDGIDTSGLFRVGNWANPGPHLDAASIYANTAWISSISGEPPLSLDVEANNYREMEPLTGLDALLAVGRFASTEWTDREYLKTVLGEDTLYYDLADTDALRPYYEKADARKKAILESPTTIVKGDTFIPGETYTGTAYYVSSINGNDNNDGLTPETAWKTIDRINYYEPSEPIEMRDLKPGDAVFFERGSVFRAGDGFFNNLWLKDGVTYSAYGEGPKPVFTLVPENSAREECWSLYYEGPNGEMIWKYYLDMPDVGGVILDDMDSARRVWEWPTPQGWQSLNLSARDPVTGELGAQFGGEWYLESAGEYHTVEQALTEDLTYLSRMDLTDLTYPIQGNDGRLGELYLRCDKGNPGLIYQDVEVISRRRYQTGGFAGWLMNGYGTKEFVLDNLSIKYFLDTAVGGQNDITNNVVIQNCTFEWGGLRFFGANSATPSNDFFVTGDTVGNVCRNATIRNNYFYQTNTTCGFETQVLRDDMTLYPGMGGTYQASGNLIQECGSGIALGLWGDAEIEFFEALILDNNIIMDTGSCNNLTFGAGAAAMFFGEDEDPFASKYQISNNILLGSKMTMVACQPTLKVKMEWTGNVIAQRADGFLLNDYEFVDEKNCLGRYPEDFAPTHRMEEVLN